MYMLNHFNISSSAMKAQGTRMKIIAENIANASSTSHEPGKEPYRRKVVSFKNVIDKQTGHPSVDIHKIYHDQSAFKKKHDPSHPAADEKGYVSYPNVNMLLEMMDMKEASRSYQANLNAIKISKSMFMETLNILK